MYKEKNSISPVQVLKITNILRSLGLNTSYRGTKIINKIIQYVIKYDIEFITLEKIYKIISKEYGFNISTMRNNINNALNNRNKTLSKTNFQKYLDMNIMKKILSLKYLLKKLVI